MSSSFAIALIAGVFAVYQLRALPRERRGRILDSMTKKYSKTAELRQKILRECPVLLKLAYRAVGDELNEQIRNMVVIADSGDSAEIDIAEGELQHLLKLRREAELWGSKEIGISYTSAAEIYSSEFKTRALLWCVETIRSDELRLAAGLSREMLDACKNLVGQWNDFAMNYENGTYPPRTLLGQLHRSIAPAAKAVEPVIWEQSTGGRWGRRVLRLGLAAQHFNDVVKVHRSSDLAWTKASPEGSDEKDVTVIHPASTIDIFGKEVIRPNIPTQPRILPGFRLWIRTAYWLIIGKLSLRPSLWLWEYGGVRLRRHRRYEDRLSAFLGYVLDVQEDTQEDPERVMVALDFAWSLQSVREVMRVKAQEEKASAQVSGRTSWLYLRNPFSRA